MTYGKRQRSFTTEVLHGAEREMVRRRGQARGDGLASKVIAMYGGLIVNVPHRLIL